MKIIDIGRETTADGARVGASIVWEDVARPPMRLEFAVEGRAAADLTADPNAFALIAAVPAFQAGEARVAITGAMSPRLRDGVTVATRLLGEWWGPPRRPLDLEPSDGFRPARPAERPRTALFLSGGIDSLCALRLNRRDYPLGHPDAIQDALFVYGLDIGIPGTGDQNPFFQRALDALRPVAAEADLEIVVVRTNLRELGHDVVSWPDQWVAAATTALAHGLSSRLTRVLLAASLHLPDLAPCGSHPLLDPCYSTEALQVVHEGAHRSRLEKIGVVAQWPTALASLRVCYQELAPDGPLNCGRCLKCVRTMLGLLVHGALEAVQTFPLRDVTPDMIEQTRMESARNFVFYRSVLDPLERRGRRDLADAIRRSMRAYARLAAWRADRGWRGALRRLDRRWLGGSLLRASRFVGRDRSGLAGQPRVARRRRRG